MNKQDLIDFVANKTGVTKKDAHNAVDAVFDGIVSGLKADEEAKFVGFGSFAVTASKVTPKVKNTKQLFLRSDSSLFLPFAA